ncbi:Dps family protein [Foetidibacter luteolus]|uniref:Dps family protein n=1 Tax=Foetidibacter luteolus TaxID=2608880 RepID=UPI001F2E28E9|nr:DNA starvation/stationary phase protection protein [Foetidibacter luteolus]
MKAQTAEKSTPKVNLKSSAAVNGNGKLHQDIKTDIGITDKNRQEVAMRLTVLLADEHVLYAKIRNYHWNVEGDNFMEMHKFYEGLYNDLAEQIDEIAERIRQLGHYAQGRLKDFLKLTNLEEQEYTNDQRTQLQNLLDDNETIVKYLRKDIDDFDEKYKDAGNTDFITGIMKNHEKWSWFIRSYLR